MGSDAARAKLAAAGAVTLGEFVDQVDTAQALLEIEFEGCLEVGVEPLAFAHAAAQTAAVVFGHHHRAMGTCDAHFREFVLDFAGRLLQEATRHRLHCRENGEPPPSGVSRLTH